MPLKMIIPVCTFLALLAVPTFEQDSGSTPRPTHRPDMQRTNYGLETKPVNSNLLLFNRPPSNEGDLNISSGDNQNRVRPENTTLTTQWSSQGKPKPPSQCGQVVSTWPPFATRLEGEWPWQIALYKLLTVDYEYICGGTLVSHKHVITAAHCVTRKSSQRLVDKHSLTVYLGKRNLRTSVEGVQIRFVKEIFVNPNYNASTYSRDVAILELHEPVTYSDWVRPACLWPDDQIDLRNVIGKKGSVVGWGFNEIGVANEELSLVEMPVVSQETCLKSYIEFSKYTSKYTYCAGYNIEGNSVCNGDSGGGMVFRQNGVWYLRGLVSLVLTRQNEDRCDPTHYVIFTDLAKFLPWIYDTVSDF